MPQVNRTEQVYFVEQNTQTHITKGLQGRAQKFEKGAAISCFRFYWKYR